MNDIKERKAKITRWVQVGLIGVAGLIAVPFVFLAIKGIIGLIIAALLGFTVVAFAPWVSDKFANWRLKAIKKEAWANPIETFQMEYIRNGDKLKQFEQQLTQFTAELEKFLQDFERFKPDLSPDEVRRYEAQISAYHKMKAFRQSKFEQALRSQVKFKKEIEKAERSYKMALAAIRMNNVAGADFDPLEQIRRDTAIESVQTAVATSFADMETELLKENSQALLEHMPAGQVIDVIPVRVKEGVS